MALLCFVCVSWQALLPLARAGESLVQAVRIRRLNTFHAVKMCGGHRSSWLSGKHWAKTGVCSACSIYDCTIDGGHHTNANVPVGLVHDNCGAAHYQQWAAAKSELILGIAKPSAAAVVLVQNNDCQTAAYLYSQFRHLLFQSSMQNSNMTSCSFIHRGDEGQLVASKWPHLYMCLAQRCAGYYHHHTEEEGLDLS